MDAWANLHWNWKAWKEHTYSAFGYAFHELWIQFSGWGTQRTRRSVRLAVGGRRSGVLKAREAKAKAESARVVEQMVKSNQASRELSPSQYYPSPSRCFQVASHFSRAAIYDRKIKPLNNPMSACCVRWDTFDARDNVNLGSWAVFFSSHPLHHYILVFADLYTN